jgi:hypothetical protein
VEVSIVHRELRARLRIFFTLTATRTGRRAVRGSHVRMEIVAPDSRRNPPHRRPGVRTTSRPA